MTQEASLVVAEGIARVFSGCVVLNWGVKGRKCLVFDQRAVALMVKYQNELEAFFLSSERFGGKELILGELPSSRPDFPAEYPRQPMIRLEARDDSKFWFGYMTDQKKKSWHYRTGLVMSRNTLQKVLMAVSVAAIDSQDHFAEGTEDFWAVRGVLPESERRFVVTCQGLGLELDGGYRLELNRLCSEFISDMVEAALCLEGCDAGDYRSGVPLGRNSALSADFVVDVSGLVNMRVLDQGSLWFELTEATETFYALGSVVDLLWAEPLQSERGYIHIDDDDDDELDVG